VDEALVGGAGRVQGEQDGPEVDLTNQLWQ
jgi:hypothetical protein